MPEFFKTIFKDLSKDYIKEWIKANYMQYCSFASITIGGIMITQHIIGWFLVFLGFIIGIYQIQKKYKRLEEILSNIQHSSQDIQEFACIDKKLLPFDTRLQIVDNKYLDFGLCVDNLSNQAIECVIDIDKSSFVVNGLTIAKEQLKWYKNNLYPFATHAVWVQIMRVETIPVASEFEISCKMHLDYNAFSQPLVYSVTCQFKGTFIMNIDNNGELSINLIKVTQPASPIN